MYRVGIVEIRIENLAGFTFRVLFYVPANGI